MVRAIRCFKCHEDTAVLTYEENRIYKVCCPCGCEYTFEHSSQTAANDYHLKMVELYAEIDRNAALTAENASLRAQLTASQQETRAAVEDMKHIVDRIQSCNEKLLNDKDAVSSLNLGRCDVCKKHCHDDSGCRFEWRGDVGRKD